jgi:3-deoxy-manno-octulosonate cytidylyltransferase (CMP-KDO synthetase)
VEHHGKIPLQNVIAIIPARYSSVRLTGKLLLPVAGKPLILHTLAQAGKASHVTRVIVATDDKRIFQVVQESGGEAVMTADGHQSGSDRIAEVARDLPEGSIIVNVQGDEPLISPKTIDLAVEALIADPSADISTTCERITDVDDVLSPDIVKVVMDDASNALYFSRSPIPFPRDAVKDAGSIEKALRDSGLLELFRKHTGLYVFRREYLLEFTGLAQTALEKTEMLEQLRALENGARIKVVETIEGSIGVDTAEDLERVRAILEEHTVAVP